MSMNDLKAEYRLTHDGDAWGQCMHWWFTIADDIYFNRDFDVPAEWRFRPSPLGPSNDDDDYVVSVVRNASDDDLMAFGHMMNRLASILKAAGKDY